jgi:hypothetical protein
LNDGVADTFVLIGVTEIIEKSVAAQHSNAVPQRLEALPNTSISGTRVGRLTALKWGHITNG